MDQRVLRDLLSEKLPRLTAHLGQHHIDLSLITFNWFLVVFADSLISDLLLRVWDAFLYEGTKVGIYAWTQLPSQASWNGQPANCQSHLGHLRTQLFKL